MKGLVEEEKILREEARALEEKRTSLEKKTFDLSRIEEQYSSKMREIEEISSRTEKDLAPASNRLNRLDDQLDAMLTEWTSTLQTNLADPFIQLDLMKSEQKAEVTEFINSGGLPEPLTKDFVEEVNKVLDGLVAVAITSQELVVSLGKGTPQSVEDVRKRFEQLIAERCKGQDSDKVRIVIE